MWMRAAKHAATIVITVLLAGFMGTLLVRLAPGFEVDDRTLDPRLSAASAAAIRHEHGGDRSLLGAYGSYLAGIVHGDLGVSRMLNRPVLELLGERAPVTAVSILLGLLGGWGLGFSLAVLSVALQSRKFDIASSLFSGFFLCLPAAVLGLAFLFARAPGRLAIALIVFPKVFRYAKNLLDHCYALPHVLTARAKGLSQTRILLWHILPNGAPQLLALAGVSVSMAVGAAIPIEVICDSAGIGQLAWQAALARDLPLLVNVTLLVTFVTMMVNSGCDLASYALAPVKA
jgi:peptide/nickel transport system permease protein